MIEVSTGEIQRVGAWSLRALGLKFGSADRAAPLLVSTECGVGGALSTLRRNEAAMKESSGNPIGRTQRDIDFWTLEAGPRSLLQTGPIALDLVTYAARRYGSGRVDFTGCFDPVFAPALSQLAVRRGIGFVLIAQELLQSQKLGTFRWFAALPSAGGVYLRGDEAAVPAPIFGMIDAVVASKISQGSRWLAALDPGQQGCSIVGFRFDGLVDRQEQYVVDLEAGVRNGQANGVPVDSGDLSTLYRIERETWAPTSERSRSQALF